MKKHKERRQTGGEEGKKSMNRNGKRGINVEFFCGDRSGKKNEHKDLTFWVRRPAGGVGFFHAEGWGSKLRALPRKFVFLGFRREEPGTSREFCRDVPDRWGCSKSLCKRSLCSFIRPIIESIF